MSRMSWLGQRLDCKAVGLIHYFSTPLTLLKLDRMLSSSRFNLSKCGRQKDQQTSNHLDNKRWDWDTYATDFLKSFFVSKTKLRSQTLKEESNFMSFISIKFQRYLSKMSVSPTTAISISLLTTLVAMTRVEST